MAQLIAEAKDLGVPPEDYAKRLIEDSPALQREAKEKTFTQIMGSIRQETGSVSDAEIIKLVDRARSLHPRKSGRAKKR